MPYGNVGHEEDQPSLVGPGMRQRKEVVYRGMEAWNKKVLAGMKDYDQATIDDLHRAMAADIVRERQRLGGDWAVAFAVPDRRDRDVIREALGGEDAVTFVVLNLDEDLLAEHLAKKYKVGRIIISTKQMNQRPAMGNTVLSLVARIWTNKKVKFYHRQNLR